ncbi:hypothetical protein NDU88_004070, partial [Pleurodeles waltl]
HYTPHHCTIKYNTLLYALHSTPLCGLLHYMSKPSMPLQSFCHTLHYAAEQYAAALYIAAPLHTTLHHTAQLLSTLHFLPLHSTLTLHSAPLHSTILIYATIFYDATLH